MLLKTLTPPLIGIALLCAACFIGYQKGVADTTHKNLSAEITSLNNSLGDLAKQTQQAAELNLQLSKTIAARKKADDQSTKELTHALAATAHLRFNCMFNDNIMQQLYTSAERATQAASGGIVSAMPASHSPP